MFETSQDTSWLSQFHLQDNNILHDVKYFRQHDIHKLLKRLEVANKFLLMAYQKSHLSNIGSSMIKQFMSYVIGSYCACIESIKLARAVEKFLQPWMVEHHEYISLTLEEFILNVLQQSPCQTDRVTAVSFLIEQNSIVSEIINKNIDGVLEWIAHHLKTATSKQTPCLTKKELQDIYVFIKIVLQLFQYHPIKSCCKLWSGEAQGNLQQNLRAIVKSVYLVLTSQDFSTDCILLAGTTMALLFTSAPDAVTTIGSFEYLLGVLFVQGEIFSVDKLISGNCMADFSDYSLAKLGQLSVVRGMVACSDQKILSYQRTDHSGHYIVKLFQLICNLCEGPVIFQYQAFNLLNLYFKKLSKLCSNDAVNVDLNCDKVAIVEKTLKLIWLNWDSPVEDVSGFVMQTFTSLMELWTVQVQKLGHLNLKVKLPQVVLEKITKMAWYIKGKYLIFSALLPFVNQKQVLADYPDIKDHLLKCLSTNYLAPSGGDLYKAFLQELKKTGEKESESLWKEIWMQTVLKALTSDNILLRNNASHYWIPSTLKILPKVGHFLASYLSGQLHDGKFNIPRQRMLHACISIRRIIRNTTPVIDIQDVDIIKEALYSSDEDVRSEAIALLSTSIKKAEPLSELECKLFKEVIPCNLKIDSAAFRIQFGSSLRRLITRVRDSCLAMLKSKETDKLDMSISFVNWLQNMCFNNLIPGACYQRLKGSLDVIQIILETLVYTEDAKQRKSFTPEATLKLQKYAEEKGKWNFFSANNTVCLLHCMLDGADDIQELACNLLLKYFTFPVKIDSTVDKACSSEELMCHMLSHALYMCNSPKTHESQSGALLCKLIFSKCVLENHIVFKVEVKENGYMVDVAEKDVSHEAHGVLFIQSLFYLIETSLSSSKNNVVVASKMSSIHGFVSAVTGCITECNKNFTEDKMNIKAAIYQIIDINIQIVHLMLGIMGKDAENGSSPSFAEMGTALESWIAENQSDYTETTSLSVEHQYLLSWCWVNIKESCTSLGQLMKTYLQDLVVTLVDKADISVVQNVSQTFLKVFTCCRHRGVIEGCRNAFVKFCLALFSSDDSQINQLPEKILEEALDGLQSKANVTSTTRKSAGLPLIIQAIVTCENKMKKDKLLTKALDKLFDIASLPMSSTADDQHDLPQVHGLNVLKSLYSDASLSSVLMPYISRAVILVINKFGSPAWSVRNAATRLFSSLVTRIFKQKKSTDDSSWNSVSLLEFSAHYPELCPFMLKHLNEAAQQDIKRIDQLHPSLFPILTLLANLGPMESKYEIVDTFKDIIRTFLGSPVYGLRQLAASAYVALIPSNDAFVTMVTLLNDIPATYKHQSNQNYWHGLLCCIEKLLVNIRISDSDADALVDDLLVHKWIYCEDASVCSVISAKYLDILLKLLQMYNVKKETIKSIIQCQRDKKENCYQDIGYPLLCKRQVDLTFSMYRQNEVDLCGYVQTYLSSSVVDTRSSCLAALNKLFTSDILQSVTFWRKIQDCCVEKLPLETYQPVISEILNLIKLLYLKYGADASVTSVLHQWLRNSRELNPVKGKLSSGLLTISAICLNDRIEQKCVDHQELLSWCQQLHLNSHLTGNEDLRIAAGQSLVIVGEKMLNYCLQRPECMKSQRCAMDILQTCLNLVQDENTEIRSLAVDFISALNWDSKSIKFSSIQYNNCLQLLFEYITDIFWWSEVCVSCLQQLLYKPGNIRHLLENKLSPSHQQLFDQDDNSFFAENLFTGLYMFNALMKMIRKSEDVRNFDQFASCNLLVKDLQHDMEYLISFIEQYVNSKPIFNVFCDGSVLTVVTGMLFFSKIMVRLKNTCNTEDNKMLHKLIVQHENILKIANFPPSVKTLLDVPMDDS